jgi:hypothetical protein
MVVQERYAAFRLGVTMLALAMFLLLTERMGPWRGQSAFSVLALLGLEPFLYRWRKDRVGLDERDRAMHLRAIQWGMGAFWLVFSLGIWITYMAMEPARQVPVGVLSLVAWLSATAFLLCNAAATLLVYRLS